MSWHGGGRWGRYVPVAERRAKARRKVAKLQKAGRKIQPVEIAGRAITTTFWGKAWCANLEAYSDYANRLPRGRTYARNGSVVDLQIGPGRIDALVAGSSLYEVALRITPLPKARWKAVREACAGQIHSLVELLGGRISKGVMEIVSRPGQGLFPAPKEIKLGCSCPDWAVMCKHVAASLYGVGARLDHDPAMLFALRGVDPAEMIAEAVDRGVGGPSDQRSNGTSRRRGRAARTLSADDLSSVFGVDIDAQAVPAQAKAEPKAKPKAKAKASGTSKVLELIEEIPGLRSGEIANCAGLSATATEAALADLLARGVIVQTPAGDYDLATP